MVAGGVDRVSAAGGATVRDGGGVPDFDDEQIALLPTPLEAEQTVGVTTAVGGTMAPIAALLLDQLDEAGAEIRRKIELSDT